MTQLKLTASEDANASRRQSTAWLAAMHKVQREAGPAPTGSDQDGTNRVSLYFWSPCRLPSSSTSLGTSECTRAGPSA